MKRYDLIVIGGGAGGLSVASAAAQLGLSVMLIEKSTKLGGDCLHYGCVPSKSLIHSAKVRHTFKNAHRFGFDATIIETDLARVNESVQGVIDSLQPHDSPERFVSLGVDLGFGNPRFVSSHEVELNTECYYAKKFVIATGSHSLIPPIPGLTVCQYVTNESIFKLKTLPKHLLVLGGGPIGIELAQAMHRLGAHVSIIEMAPHILPMIDESIAVAMEDTLRKEGIDLYLSSQVMEAWHDHDAKICTLTCQDGNGKAFTLTGDKLLIATGRVPNIAGLGLEAAAVAYDKRGIIVDKYLRTSQKHIFAIGDVTATPLKFTHVAEYHAGIVISNALFRLRRKTDYRVIPTVVYTDPEIATVGLSEKQAREKGYRFQVIEMQVKDIDRAITSREDQGLIKCLVRRNKILGVAIMGQHAGELIAEFALAMNANLPLRYLTTTVHAYPTMAQLNRRVINKYFASKLFSDRVRRLVRWLF